MVIGIDPKVDYAFKWLFGNEKNTRILIHLLHAILNPPPEEQIAEIHILNLFNDKMSLDEKLSILDIKARDQLGRQFNIEMQMVPAGALLRRVLYYWAKLYAEPLREGDDYDWLRPTISVCFVDGVVFPAIAAHHLSFRLLEPEHGVAFTDDLHIHFFELPKFQRTAAELTTPLDAWLYFLKGAQELDVLALPVTLDVPEIRQAVEVLGMLAQTDIQREIYEGRLKARRDERSRVADARKQGMEEGLQQGVEQGITKGALIGGIEILQQLLGQTPIPRGELETREIDELQRMEEQLMQQLKR